MDGAAGTFFAIIGYVLVAAWLSRRVAIDMDTHGKAGWAYGMMTFVIPPLGIALWLLDRNRPPTHAEWGPQIGTVGDGMLFALLIITFPWGLLLWLFLNRRASPTADPLLGGRRRR